jgi:diguanylate cyclase (GGDEF)-like protein/PAS domain S-box-containing protein
LNDWLHIYLAVTALAGSSSAILAMLAWRRRGVPGAAFLAVMLAGAAIWCGACVAELLSPTLFSKLLSARIAYLGVVAIPWSWLLFALTYTGRGPRRMGWVALALAPVPLATLSLVVLAPRVPLVWSAVRLAASTGEHPLLVSHGWWFWVNATFAYACLFAGSALLLAAVFRVVRPLTAQGVTIVLAITLPWVSNILTIVGAAPLAGLDLTPPAMAASGALIAFALMRMQALDVYPGIVPAARDALLQGMRDGVLIIDRYGRVLNANRASEELLWSHDGPLLGRHVGELLEPVDCEGAACYTLAALTKTGTLEAVVPGHDGQQRFLEIVVSNLGTGPQSSGYVLAMRDISERKLLEEELIHRALYDELTELPNRRLLGEHLDELLKLSKRSGGGLSLLVIDLDHFKEINDTFGHEAGDELLCVMANRLRAARRESDLVTRLGGDEFAVVLPACGAHDAVRIATSLREQLIAPIELRNQQVSVAAAIGVAASPAHGRTPGTLLRHADVALYAAKDSLDGVATYQARRDLNSRARLAMLDELRAAIENDGLALHYQPQVELREGRVLRLEALARWPQANGRTILPAEFIPLAEQHGLLPSLTKWVLGAALRRCAEWNQAGYGVDVAVNLSALDLHDPALVKRVAAELERAGVEPERLWLEVTETSIMRSPDRARRILASLREMGVRVAIDDFGTGQSSLAYLRALPANDVKIDQSFIRQMASQPDDAAIVRAAVTLAHDLGLSATAEGVEDAGTLEHLRHIGCDQAQGYFIARPMPSDAVLGWLRERLPVLTDRPLTSSQPRVRRAS